MELVFRVVSVTKTHNEGEQIVIWPKMPPWETIFPFESAVGFEEVISWESSVSPRASRRRSQKELIDHRPISPWTVQPSRR